MSFHYKRERKGSSKKQKENKEDEQKSHIQPFNTLTYEIYPIRMGPTPNMSMCTKSVQKIVYK